MKEVQNGGAAAEKNALRKAIREKLRAFDIKDREAASAQIAARVVLFPLFQQAETIFTYVGTDTEPRTEDIIDTALCMGKRVLVPRCLPEHRMEAVQIESRDQLARGHYGILEPADGLPVIDGYQIDLALVPCLSADAAGGRLGHGAGYYDRYLRGLSCTKMALCFERMMSEYIPMEDTDIRMDRVAAESEIFNCRLEQSGAQARRQADGFLQRLFRK